MRRFLVELPAKPGLIAYAVDLAKHARNCMDRLKTIGSADEFFNKWASRGPSRALRLRDRGEALQRGLANAQRTQFRFAQLFGAARNYPHSALDEYLAELRIGRRGGDVTEGSQQPQADGHVRFRIHADLLKGCLQQALEMYPFNAGANDARRIVEQLLRRLS